MRLPKLTYQEAACFLLPCFMFEIQAGGRLLIVEPLLLGILPFLIIQPGALKLLQDHRVFKILLFGLVWLLAQAVSDLYNGTSIPNLARGWAKIVFTLSSLTALLLLTQCRARGLVLLMLGLATGQIFRVWTVTDPQVDLYPWKMGYAHPISLYVVLLSCWYVSQGRWIFGGMLPIALGLFSFFLNARSAAGMLMASGGYTAVIGNISKLESRYATLRAGLLVFASVFGLQLIISVYELGASSGFFGEDAKAKYTMQVADTDEGVFESGRMSVWRVSWRAIQDSPIMGHGSWYANADYAFEDPHHRAEAIKTLSRRTNLQFSGLVLGHSFFMNAWVQSGLIGALFWIYLIYLSFELLYKVSLRQLVLAPLFAFTSISLIWNILFSPFGLHMRFLTAASIVVLIVGLRIVDHENAKDQKAARQPNRTLKKPIPSHSV